MKIERKTMPGCSHEIVTILPRNGAHSATIVMLPGFSEECDSMLPIAEDLHQALPYVKFMIISPPIFPTVSGGICLSGQSWFDVERLSKNQYDSFLELTVPFVQTILDAENASGTPYSRMILCGYGQSGAMSLIVGLQSTIKKKLGGLLLFSGYLLGKRQFQFAGEHMKDLKVLNCHGSSDIQFMCGMFGKQLYVCKSEWLNNTETFLKSSCGMTNYVGRCYSDLAVTEKMNERVFNDAVIFISYVLPDGPSYIIRPKLPSDMSVKELNEAIRHYGLESKTVGMSEKPEFVKLL